MTETRREAPATRADAGLRKDLGFWSLLAAGLGSVIGSGWLFSSLYAAQDAGPAAMLAWVIGGALMLCVALVFAELGMAKPESGGLVRYPMYSHGGLAAGVVGWANWISYVGNPPTEAAGVVQYAAAYLPGVYEGDRLTVPGIALAVVLMAGFVALNWFGVRLFARSNTIITAIKILIPTTTVVLLVASGFDSSNLTDHGGFAPYGWSAALGSIATAGMVFAYTGFRNVVELSGEARDPRRTVPRALIITILVTIVLYLGLQLAFLGAVPGSALLGGWHGVNFDSPFADLAMVLGLSWLSWTLIADSMLSPSGSGIVFTAANARNVFGLAKNGFFPSWLTGLNARGVPARALAVNFVIGLAYLLPLPSWHSIISVTGSIAAFTFQIGSVSLIAFRRSGLTRRDTRLRGMTVVAPVAFVVSSLVIFWVAWPKLRIAMAITVIGVVVYVVVWLRSGRPAGQLSGGWWLVVYLAGITVLSALGSFDGAGLLPAPWDSVVVAVFALVIYSWGVRSGVAHMLARPDMVRDLRAEADHDRGDAPEVTAAR
ncbi:APC family permease [Actinomycetospora sp. NBRC 106378]|uniref:APC family permease n=1 Tax=Actinomycetospora sp. NBRC 106378 TaxID=3032208 RepID=UPI0024A56502|nr:APC family permease [Actinomycetospora sp. NBRC 106378]GLZ55236.1 ABC transporter permease [Actinomycetospora sp. NBRC 106378]